MLMAVSRGRIFCIKKLAILLPRPEMNDGLFPNRFMQASTTSRGLSTLGAKKLFFSGFVLIKLGVAVADTAGESSHSCLSIRTETFSQNPCKNTWKQHKLPNNHCPENLPGGYRITEPFPFFNIGSPKIRSIIHG
jgi:hypothetical protein